MGGSMSRFRTTSPVMRRRLKVLAVGLATGVLSAFGATAALSQGTAHEHHHHQHANGQDHVHHVHHHADGHDHLHHHSH
jgi:hypothetical protein